MQKITEFINKLTTGDKKKTYIAGAISAVIIFAIVIMLLLWGPAGMGFGKKAADTLNVEDATKIVVNFTNTLKGGSEGACYNNMMELNVRAQSWLSVETNATMTPPSTYEKWLETFAIAQFTCPDKDGTYSMDDKGNVACSVHGNMAELKSKVEKNGMLTVTNADAAYNSAVGTFVEQTFITNLKNAFTQLTPEQRAAVDNFAILNGYIYAADSANLAVSETFTMEGNKLILTGNPFINNITFKKQGDKWLMSDIEFNGSFLNPGAPEAPTTTTITK